MNKIVIDGITFPYTIKHTNIKNVSIQYHSDGSITVRANKKFSKDVIEQFMLEKRNWLLKQYNRERNVIIPTSSELVLFGKLYEVSNQIGRSSVTKTNEQVIVYSKEVLSEEKLMTVLDKYRQKLLEQYLESIRSMVEEVTSVYDVVYAYRYMKTRFGTCAVSRKKITFNSCLCSLSVEEIQCVVFHEYAHFFQRNHSSKFYEVLAKFYPNYKLAEKKLKTVVLR